MHTLLLSDWQMKNTNDMDIALITGCVAGTFTTIAFLPQVIQSWQLKETRDLSLVMLVILCTGVSLWILYGFWMNSLPLIISNMVTITLVGFLLILKSQLCQLTK